MAEAISADQQVARIHQQDGRGGFSDLSDHAGAGGHAALPLLPHPFDRQHLSVVFAGMENRQGLFCSHGRDRPQESDHQKQIQPDQVFVTIHPVSHHRSWRFVSPA